MHKPLISIVLPSYDGEKYLSQSIDSVLGQSYSNLELLIVDDASKDSTLDIARHYEKLDTRVKVINNEVNQGLPKSLNIGFAKAAGEYLSWTSDDNYYEKNALEKMHRFMELNEDCVMVCADYKILRDGGKTSLRRVEASPESMLKQCGVGACFLYRAKVAREIGAYDESRFLVEDYDYWLRLGLAGKIGELHEVIYTYRQHAASLTSQKSMEIMRLRIELQVDFMERYAARYPQLREGEALRILQAFKILKNASESPAKALLDLLKPLGLPPKVLYGIFKDYYKATRDQVFLELIKCLGMGYAIKGALLKRRLK